MPGNAGNRLKLPLDRRLRDSRVFRQLKAGGKRLSIGSIIINWEILPPDGTSQIGVITSRRLGNSVIRSRARRLMREVFRLHQNDMTNPVRMVLIAKPSIVGRSLSKVEKDYFTFLRQANLLKKPA